MRLLIICMLSLTGLAVIASPPVRQYGDDTRTYICREVVAELRLAEQEGLLNSVDAHNIMHRCYNRSATPPKQP